MYNTNFGFKKVAKNEKQHLVQNVFSDVAKKYDLMNDIMSFGLHRYWKYKFSMEFTGHNKKLIDVASGTGDIARTFIKNYRGAVTICDLNEEMLKFGRGKFIDENLYPNDLINWVCANAESLPFNDNTFDICSIAFGIRNITNIEVALREFYRILKPGGKFMCLEFSNVHNEAIRNFYDMYSFNIIPRIGKIIAGNADHYKYLIESIRVFPNAEHFQQMIQDAKFKFVKFSKMTFGIVAIHTGYKI